MDGKGSLAACVELVGLQHSDQDIPSACPHFWTAKGTLRELGPHGRCQPTCRFVPTNVVVNSTPCHSTALHHTPQLFPSEKPMPYTHISRCDRKSLISDVDLIRTSETPSASGRDIKPKESGPYYISGHDQETSCLAKKNNQTTLC